MESKANVVWKGGLKNGKGVISTPSGILHEVPYSFSTRFEGAPGTSPEELIAAAHAGCFSMALSAELEKSQVTAESIETSAVVTLAKNGQGFSIEESRLQTTVTAKGKERELIEVAAAAAKENCPVSKVLNARITLELEIQT